MRTKRWYCSICLALLLPAVFAGCKTGPATSAHKSGLSIVKIKRFAVMPFIKGLPDTKIDQSMRRMLYCNLANLCFNIKELKGNADELMTRHLQEALQKNYGEALIPLQEVQPAYSGLPKNPYSDTPQALAVALGKKLNADHIMVGTVWRYQERIGSATGSPSPASVAFALYLVNVENGNPVWEATFDKTQQSLSENLLNYKEFFNMGARWLTADELARYGIDQVLGVTQK
jgi:hypothetical protein